MPLNSATIQLINITKKARNGFWCRPLLLAGCFIALVGCEQNTRPQAAPTTAQTSTKPLVINLDLVTANASNTGIPKAQTNNQDNDQKTLQSTASTSQLVTPTAELSSKLETELASQLEQQSTPNLDLTPQAPTHDSDKASSVQVTNNPESTAVTRGPIDINQLARQKQLLDLANSMLDKGYVDLSLSLLQDIDITLLSPDYLGTYLESMAASHLRSGDSFNALAWLHKADALAPALNQVAQHKRLTLFQQAYHDNDQFLEAALTAISLAAYLPPSTASAQLLASNNDIWELLMQVPNMQLHARLQSPLHPLAKAWLELALSTENLITLEQQQQAILAWQLTNPLHPASLRLPSVLSNLSDLQAKQAQKLALLLPTSGPLGKLGQAVIDGFMANYYQTLAQCENPCSLVPQLVFINSHEVDDWPTLFTQLEEQQVDLIIGPLAKTKVDSLNAFTQRSIQTLALNYLSSAQDAGHQGQDTDIDSQLLEELEAIAEQVNPASGSTNSDNNSQEVLFQFGLSLEDEARQLATQGHRQGFKQALIIQADTSWAQRASITFQQEWQLLGGRIAGKIDYIGNGDYADSISKVLHIDDSKARRSSIQKLIGEKVKFEPRRRQDVDLIVLLGLPKDVRQLMPTLAFHHAAKVTTYSTHHAYQGPTETTRDRDLNNLYFSDIPWMLEADETTHLVQKTWPNRQRYSRLFALGADSYRLYPRLEQMQIFNATRVHGTTGLLKLEDDNRITANLTWARFSNGQPQVHQGAHELQ